MWSGPERRGSSAGVEWRCSMDVQLSVLFEGGVGKNLDKRVYGSVKRACSRDVKISDGSIIKAEAIGEVRVKAFNDFEWIETILRNVLYVPTLKVNLFSISTIVKKGLKMSFNKVGCRVFDANGNFCAIAVKCGKLFEMQCKIESSFFLAGGQKQFGSVLKRFDIDFKDNEDECCTSCLEEKQHRFQFYSSTAKYNNVGEMVSADLCGPMEVANIGGSLIEKKNKKKNKAGGEDESVASYDLRDRCLLNKPMYLDDYSMLSAVSLDENLTYDEATSGLVNSGTLSIRKLKTTNLSSSTSFNKTNVDCAFNKLTDVYNRFGPIPAHNSANTRTFSDPQPSTSTHDPIPGGASVPICSAKVTNHSEINKLLAHNNLSPSDSVVFRGQKIATSEHPTANARKSNKRERKPGRAFIPTDTPKNERINQEEEEKRMETKENY
ncbi:hypothetical protein ILUMI_11972 [Ignelater luminosus]|uniref:Retrovirus-related Pol polyprotein from transposon TNT 1-94-like beta-barrel domain-containing protein n=1 Tax=Ignelater luminosus TaxID=2038154 RepID=A0A8K0CV16_IGNLU|nr:hypothetical protein ILUMI_11972 [Ignelater luminosus]